MRFLLDMGASRVTRDALRSAGHDAVHLADEGLQRLPDVQIMQKALAEQRIVVTFDLDFSALLALGRLANPSVILFRLERVRTELVNTLLFNVIAKHRTELEAGAIVVVEEDRMRVRALPIF